MQLRVEGEGSVVDAVGPLEVEGERPVGAMEVVGYREGWQCGAGGEEEVLVEVVADLPMDHPVHQTF